ncbi:tail fiber domain-containing protein [Maribellus mangrovi]|uniref:tail fiber domain-containing protein n=1 Tax=Maribellus mangrovi TaxID=3133146 RepID=UPI0030EF6B3F
MKKYIILISAFVTIMITNQQLNAQIKVNSDGQIKILGDRETDDPNKDLSMQVFGKYGTYLTNGKIAVGDYGRVENSGANVFIGELGTNWDSDRLELHGKKGIYLTYEQGYNYGDIIGKWDIDQPDRFQFEVDVYAKGIKLNSDEKFKTNIKPLGKKLDVLKQLKGVSYKLKQEKIKLSPEEIEELSGKEQEDLALINSSTTDDRTRLGFLAQDVEALFPELVEEDKDGYKYVDYVGLIPVLVESVKEQQEQIDELLKLAEKKGLLNQEN